MKSSHIPARIGLDRNKSVDVNITSAQSILCLKKSSLLYFCNIFVRFCLILLIFGKNIPQEIWNKHKCTAHHILFHMFVLYVVKSCNDFYGIQ